MAEENKFLYYNNPYSNDSKIILPITAAEGVTVLGFNGESSSNLQKELDKLNLEKDYYKSTNSQIKNHSVRTISETTHNNIYSKYKNELDQHNFNSTTHMEIRSQIEELKKELEKIQNYEFLQGLPDTQTTIFYNKEMKETFEILKKEEEIIATKKSKAPTLNSYEEEIEIKISETESKKIKTNKINKNDNEWEQTIDEKITPNTLPKNLNLITLKFNTSTTFLPIGTILQIQPFFSIDKNFKINPIEYKGTDIQLELPLGVYKIQGIYQQNNSQIKSTIQYFNTYNNFNVINLNISYPLINIKLKENRQPRDYLNIELIEQNSKEIINYKFNELTSGLLSFYLPVYSEDNINLSENSDWKITKVILTTFNLSQETEQIELANIAFDKQPRPGQEYNIELIFGK